MTIVVRKYLLLIDRRVVQEARSLSDLSDFPEMYDFDELVHTFMLGNAPIAPSKSAA